MDIDKQLTADHLSQSRFFNNYAVYKANESRKQEKSGTQSRRAE